MSEPTWEMRSATEADMRWLAPRLTPASREEMAALSKFQTVSVLLQDITRKGVILDRVTPTRPLMVFDVIPSHEDQEAATFWSAMSESIASAHSYWSFAEYSRSILNSLNGKYPVLTSYVDARNTQQMGWLERVGFVHVEDVPQYGRKQLPFRVYRRLNGDTH